eukprot:299609-Pelagomonas_calceolata.AAC.2
MASVSPGGRPADSRLRPSSSQARIANENTSAFSLYGLPLATSGLMYNKDPHRPANVFQHQHCYTRVANT